MRVRNTVYQGRTVYSENKNTPEQISKIQEVLADIIVAEIKRRQGL